MKKNNVIFLVCVITILTTLWLWFWLDHVLRISESWAAFPFWVTGLSIVILAFAGISFTADEISKPKQNSERTNEETTRQDSSDTKSS